MTFDQVLVFHKIIQTGSFKGAAEELNRTQPAISLSMKRLEEELAVPLFDRSSYRPTLTAYGKMFLERSLKVLLNMQELENLTQSFQNKEEPELGIAIDGISPLPRLLRLFKQFGEGFPNTKLNLSFETLSESERRVLEKEAAIGITHFLGDSNFLEVVPIATVRMLPVMSRELFEERQVAREEQLRDIDQIVLADKNPRKGVSFGLLEGGKKWRLNDNNFKREIIYAGLGWGHLPEHTITRELAEQELVVLNFEDVHPRELELKLIRLKRHQFGRVARALWEELLKLN
jgi:DNA-binding transcriptional LysR family regulator